MTKNIFSRRPKKHSLVYSLPMLCLLPLLINPVVCAQSPATSSTSTVADWRLQASLGPEYDSNAKRETDQGQVVQDGLLRLTLGGEGSWHVDKHQVNAELFLGGKAFAQQQSENTLVGLGKVAYRWVFAPAWSLDINAQGRGRKLASGLRDYSTAQANVGMSTRPWGPLGLRASLGPRGFFYNPDPRYSNLGMGIDLWSQLKLYKHEVIALGVDLDAREFSATRALLNIDSQGLRSLGLDPRRDLRPSATLQLSSSRQVLLSASYALTFNHSNSLGETYLRHRGQVVAASHLANDIFLQLTAALQFTSYPGGLALSQQLLLADGDESQNMVVLTLRRAIAAGFSLEWRAGLYSNELSSSGLRFHRVTSQLGLRWSLEPKSGRRSSSNN